MSGHNTPYAAQADNLPVDRALSLLDESIATLRDVRFALRNTSPSKERRKTERKDYAQIDGLGMTKQLAAAGSNKPASECPLCSIEDGLVQEWVMKARAVARSKGLLPCECGYCEACIVRWANDPRGGGAL